MLEPHPRAGAAVPHAAEQSPRARAPTEGPHPAPRHVLPVIVLAQLLGTSPWFAVNAVMPDLQARFGWPPSAVGTLSSSLQVGFIAGTLLFALLAIADRYPARKVFLCCALAAAGSTLMAALTAASYPALLTWRALTGLFLAGIYPVGMKLAASWFPNGLGAALGWLVGALVLGTASSHALRAAASGTAAGLPWETVFVAVAALCALAGLAVSALIPDPMDARETRPAPSFRVLALASLWRSRRVRASALGYFGHMWELYTAWVLLPIILASRLADSIAVSWWTFACLASGAAGCVLGGRLALRWSSARVAVANLTASGICCLAAPWALHAAEPVFLAWLLLWGLTVVGDSPQFSTLTALNAPRDAVGSVLTLVNSIGFAISAVSIECFTRAAASVALDQLLPWLAIGPVIGLLAMRPLLSDSTR